MVRLLSVVLFAVAFAGSAHGDLIASSGDVRHSATIRALRIIFTSTNANAGTSIAVPVTTSFSPAVTGLLDTEAGQISYDALSFVTSEIQLTRSVNATRSTPGMPPMCDINGCTDGTPPSVETIPFTLSFSISPMTLIDSPATTVDLTGFSESTATTTAVPNLATKPDVVVDWTIEGPTESQSGTFSLPLHRTLGVGGISRSINITRTPEVTGPVTAWSPRSSNLPLYTEGSLIHHATGVSVDGVSWDVKSIPEPSSFLLLAVVALISTRFGLLRTSSTHLAEI